MQDSNNTITDDLNTINQSADHPSKQNILAESALVHNNEWSTTWITMLADYTVSTNLSGDFAHYIWSAHLSTTQWARRFLPRLVPLCTLILRLNLVPGYS